MQFLMRAEDQISDREVQQMVAAKNKLLQDFRALDAEGETVTAEQVKDAMFRAFNRITQRAAA
jgi:hypothetical protein